MKTHDALGEPLRPHAEYYVLDTSCIVGDCALWWRPRGRGYTTNLDEAGIYTGAEVAKLHRATDVPFPYAVVQQRAIRHVDRDKLWRDAKESMPYDADGFDPCRREPARDDAAPVTPPADQVRERREG